MQLNLFIRVPKGLYDAVGLINKAWHQHSGEIAQTERFQVEDRTPRDTGALYESVSERHYTSEKARKLMTVYFDDEPQQFEWHRVYAKYQEGLPLGTHTYTNDPRHMVYSAQTEDVGFITEWAVQTAQDALDGLDGAADIEFGGGL